MRVVEHQGLSYTFATPEQLRKIIIDSDWRGLGIIAAKESEYDSVETSIMLGEMYGLFMKTVNDGKMIFFSGELGGNEKERERAKALFELGAIKDPFEGKGWLSAYDSPLGTIVTYWSSEKSVIGCVMTGGNIKHIAIDSVINSNDERTLYGDRNYKERYEIPLDEIKLLYYLQLQILNTKNIPIEVIRVEDKINQARERRHRPVLPPYLAVDARRYVTAITADNYVRHHPIGTHASPIPHRRRGHFRYLGKGWKVWVRDCLVNVKGEDFFNLRNFYRSE